jgi:hypothetical protein
MAHAGAIYKCTVKGAMVFQDQPCPGQAPRQTTPIAPAEAEIALAADIGQMSPGDLMERIKALAAQDRALDTQRDQAQARLKAHLAGERNGRVVSQQVERFRHDWQQRIARLREAKASTLDRLRQLCPGGASGGDGQVTCRPRVVAAETARQTRASNPVR